MYIIFTYLYPGHPQTCYQHVILVKILHHIERNSTLCKKWHCFMSCISTEYNWVCKTHIGFQKPFIALIPIGKGLERLFDRKLYGSKNIWSCLRSQHLWRWLIAYIWLPGSRNFRSHETHSFLVASIFQLGPSLEEQAFMRPVHQLAFICQMRKWTAAPNQTNGIARWNHHSPIRCIVVRCLDTA